MGVVFEDLVKTLKLTDRNDAATNLSNTRWLN